MHRSEMRYFFSAKVLCFGCLFVAMLGCSGRNGDRWTRLRPATYPVRVHVAWNGEPAADATVVFETEDRSAMAVGRTDESGGCELKTFDPGDGAVAGEYRVRIEKIVITGTTRDGRLLDASVMPKTYADSETSGLTATVTESGRNDFRFEVLGPARAP